MPGGCSSDLVGGVWVRGVRVEPGAGLADGDGRGPAGLGDLVVLALGVALDLELDPRLGADLEAFLVGDVVGSRGLLTSGAKLTVISQREQVHELTPAESSFVTNPV